MTRLANKHATILYKLLTMKEGKASKKVTDLSLAPLQQETYMHCLMNGQICHAANYRQKKDTHLATSGLD